MKVCIFCLKENDSKSLEHIVPESFGNKSYVMELGTVCGDCNSKFSKFEHTALSNTIFVMERARLGKPSKKGKPAKGKVAEFEISGDDNFTPQQLKMKGLNQGNIKNYDPVTKTFTITIPSFDKSEVSASKMLLKIGLESLYKSRRNIYNAFNFDELRSFLLDSQTQNWPFLVSNHEIGKFISIPRFCDKYELNKLPCKISYQLTGDSLIVKFSYGGVSMLINLLSRDLGWTNIYLSEDTNANLHPAHFNSKARKSVDDSESKKN